MPIQLPNLDDRRFDDLFAEMRAPIPRYAREWTDHNTSDPGIMLLELFAWLTEALIYRINRIPGASEVRFLELLGIALQPARPAGVDLKVTVTGLSGPLVIAKGTPLIASSPKSITQSFETTHDVTLAPAESGSVAQALVEARPTCVQLSERLGTSDGKPHQIFRLTKDFVVLDPPPVVTVDRKPWTYREGLLGSSPDDEHFTVDPRLNVVRFGDGGQVVKIPQDNQKALPEGGKIPPKGVAIAAKYCYTLGEQDVLPRYSMFVLDADNPDLSDQVEDAVAKGATFEFTEPAAVRGANPTDLDEARNQAIKEVRRRYRAVTGQDFERLVLDNEELNIARARCLPDLDLTAEDPYTSRPGHVSLIVIPKDQTYLFRIVDGAEQLDGDQLSEELRQQFQDHDCALTSKAKVKVMRPGSTWRIFDEAQKKGYLVRNENSNLYVHDEEYLFDVAPSLVDQLDAGLLSAELRQQFKDRSCPPLASEAKVEVGQPGSTWIIIDAGRRYAIWTENHAVKAYHLAGNPMPYAQRVQHAHEFLNERRLITCRHHVVAPRYAKVSVEAGVVQIPKAKPEEVLQKIKDKLTGFFDPIRGGPDNRGWPFGRPVLVSEVHQVIEETMGVDHVDCLTVSSGKIESSQRIDLKWDELVCFDRDGADIRLRVLR